MEISSNSVVEMCEKIQIGNANDDEIKQILVKLGNQKRWAEMWKISHALRVEISWIQDANNDVWVDIGTAGPKPEPASKNCSIPPPAVKTF